MPARKPAAEKTTEHLTVNLTPDEMAQLKQLAKDDGRSVNSLVKSILVREIAGRTAAKKPFLMSIDRPGQAIWAYRTERAANLDEVRRIAADAIAEGAVKITVNKSTGSGLVNFDIWVPEHGWIDGKVEPKEGK